MSTLLKIKVIVRAREEDLQDLRTIIATALNKSGYTQHAVMPLPESQDDDAPSGGFLS